MGKNIQIKIGHKKDFGFFNFFTLAFLFLVPFFVSYIFTYAVIERSGPVTLDEESDSFREFYSDKDLNDLYKKDTNKNKIIILGYHQIREYRDTDSQKVKLFITSPETFEKEMKYLFDRGYESISLTDYFNYLNFGIKNFDLNKSFILTFDDGYASQYISALPILKKYNFSATFFIYSDCIDRYPVCMTNKEIKDLLSNNMKLGNHTLHHIYLPKYKDEIISKEIIENQNKLINNFGSSSVENVLAYPFGANDERVQNIVKNLGYLGAVGVLAKKEDNELNIYNLRRYLLGDNFTYFENLFK
ncbi:MAG: polysaccharide deacetylase family protein [Candidatus Paceibacterota bacterium]|jgi:peptidoglycan/xylan/chitin deacetylase (PgdA/CDA1 family)